MSITELQILAFLPSYNHDELWIIIFKAWLDFIKCSKRNSLFVLFFSLKRIMTSNRLPLLKGNLCRRAMCFHVLSLKEQNKSFTAFSAVTVRVRTVVFIMRPARTQAAATAAAGRRGTAQQQTSVVLLGCLPSVLLPS